MIAAAPINSPVISFESQFSQSFVSLPHSAITDDAVQQVVERIIKNNQAQNVVSIDISETAVTPKVLSPFQKLPRLDSLNLLGCLAFHTSLDWLTPFLKGKPSNALVQAVVTNFKEALLGASRKIEVKKASAFRRCFSCLFRRSPHPLYETVPLLEKKECSLLSSITKYYDHLAAEAFAKGKLFEKEDPPFYVLLRAAYLAAVAERDGKKGFLNALEDDQKECVDFLYFDAICERSIVYHPHYNVQKGGAREMVFLLFADDDKAVFKGEGKMKKILPVIELTLGDFANDKKRTQAYATVAIENESTREDITEELQMFALINGLPGVVPFYKYSDYSQSCSTVGIMMKPYPTGNLEDWLEDKKCLTLEQKQDIISCLLVGLFHIHKKQHVHGDLKTANVMLQFEPQNNTRAVFVDFGMSIRMSRGRKLKYKPTPEEAPFEWIDLKQEGLDYYQMEAGSLGALFYDLLMGGLPPWSTDLRALHDYALDMSHIVWEGYQKAKKAFDSSKQKWESFEEGMEKVHSYLKENAVDWKTYLAGLQPFEEALRKTKNNEAAFDSAYVTLFNYVEEHIPEAQPHQTQQLQEKAKKAFQNGYEALNANKEKEILKWHTENGATNRASFLFDLMISLLEPDPKKRLSISGALAKMAPLYGVAVDKRTPAAIAQDLARILDM